MNVLSFEPPAFSGLVRGCGSEVAYTLDDAMEDGGGDSINPPG